MSGRREFIGILAKKKGACGMCEENSFGLSVGSIASGVIVVRRKIPRKFLLKSKTTVIRLSWSDGNSAS